MPSVCHLHQNSGGGERRCLLVQKQQVTILSIPKPTEILSGSPTGHTKHILTSSLGKGRRCRGRIQWSPAAQHRRLPAPPSTSRPGARGVPAHQQQRPWQLLARLLPGPRIQTIQEPLLPAQPSRSPRTWTWHETYASTLHSCSFRATHRPPEPGSKTRTGSASPSRQQFCCGSRDRENWDPVTGSRSLQESPFF